MSEITKVSVVALRQRRCRAGLCFGKDASVVEVNAEQLKALQADEHLRVEVLSDDEGKTQDGEKGKALDDAVAILAPQLAEKLTAAGYDGTGKKPTVKDCEKLVDFEVSSAIRDAAWDSLTAEAQ